MSELLPFQLLQKQITSYVRDPENNFPPANIAEPRLILYSELLFNNILDTLSKTFPVCCSIFSKKDWRHLAHDFFKIHQSTSPYFYDIPKEFLTFLAEERDDEKDPDYLYELAHYEWLELALELSEISLDFSMINTAGDLLEEQPVVSPLAWIVQYQYPVHKIGKDFQPTTTNSEPTYLTILRNEQHKISFVELSALTAQLLSILINNSNLSGREALLILAESMSIDDVASFIEIGLNHFAELKKQSIILGTKRG